MEASASFADLIVEDIEGQRDRLLGRLAVQRERLGELWGWYRGRQDMPDVPAKYQAAYRLFLDHSITPWARLVVDSVVERLRVQGVRSVDVPESARAAWRAFGHARLNADQRLVYTEALIGGVGYVSVSDGTGEARITPESAFEVAHEPDLADRQQISAALKLYPLDWSREIWICELYRRDATYRWLAALDRPMRDADAFPIDSGNRRRTGLDWADADVIENDIGIVPIVPFENRVNLLSGGASEIEDCVPVLQRIDQLTLDMMLASHYSAFRQKWATGLQVPRDPDTGKPVEPYSAAVQRLWVNEKADGSFGTFDATDPGGYLSAIDSQIATLAAISRVPAHYLLQRNLANPPSAESLIASEAGLVTKVQDRQATFGESWEQAFWIQAHMSGNDIDVETLEVQWVDAEKRNPAQVADAATKLQTIGVPRPALWAFIGATPAQVEEWATESAAETLLAAVTQPTPAAEPAPPAAPGEAPSGVAG